MAPKEVDKTSVKMEWKPPMDDGGVELKGYIVEYSEIYKEQWTRVEEISTETICFIQNLTEGTNQFIIELNCADANYVIRIGVRVPRLRYQRCRH